MPSHRTTVQSVVQRVVSTKDGRSSTIYDVIDGGGIKWSTWKQPVANESNRLIGQEVEMMVREEQNGTFLNRFVDDIRAIGMNGGTTMAEQPRGGYAPVERAMGAQQPSPSALPPIQNAGPTDKDLTIWRQTAAKVSAQMSSTPQEFWTNIQPLVDYFETGTIPTQFSGEYQREPVQQEQSFIPTDYEDPGPETRNFVDSDIPF